MIEIPKLQESVAIVEDEGKPSLAFHRWWQAVAKQVESQFDSILEALVSMNDVAPITIAANYTGVVTPSNQLPKNIAFTLVEGSTDVTTSAAWSVVVTSGSITCSIGAATGVLNITAIGASSVVTVTAIYQGVTRSRQLLINLSLSAPPATGGGGGGGSSSTSTFADINSNVHAVIATLTTTAGSGGIVTLSAPLSVSVDETSPAGTFKTYGKWQWDSTGGGVWVDLAAEVSSSPDCRVTFNSMAGVYFEDDGLLSVPDSKTGLTPSSSYNFRLMARTASGTRTRSFYGTASAVGS